MRAVWKQVIDEFIAAALRQGVKLPKDWVADDTWHRCAGGAYRLNTQLPFYGFLVAEGGSPIVWRHDADRILTMAQEALIATALAECPKIAAPTPTTAPPNPSPDRSNAPRQRPRARAKVILRAALATGPMGAVEIQTAAANAGLSMKTLRRAALAVGVVIVREGFGSSGRWTWQLP